MRLPVRLAPCLLAAVTLSGCIGIQGTSTSQPTSLGPVRLTTSVCATGSPNCTATSNTGSIYEFLGDNDSDESYPVQVLYGVRLPEGTTPPETLTASLAGGGTLDFARSPSYAMQLQALEPAPAGERWWGWLSSVYSYSRNAKQAFSVTLETALPRPADGGAYPTPLRWRPVAGARSVEMGLPADRAVACGSTNDELYEGVNETSPNSVSKTTVCVDSPDPAGTRGFVEAPATDFGITAGAPTQAPPGATVGVVFQARRTGPADPATSFALKAGGGPPGGTVTLDRSSVPLGGDSGQPVVASVMVPPGTPAGSYPVTLDATAPGKPSRQATAEFLVEPVATATPTVSPAGTAAPTVTPTVAPDTTRPGLGKVTLRGRRVRFTLSEAATVVVTLGKKRVRKALPAGPGKIKLPRAKGRKVRVRAVDAAGNRSATKTLVRR